MFCEKLRKGSMNTKQTTTCMPTGCYDAVDTYCIVCEIIATCNDLRDTSTECNVRY